MTEQTIDQIDIEKILCTSRLAEGKIVGDDGAEARYRIRLLPPGRINAIKIEREAYLFEQGIEECTPSTAEIYDAELRIRICAEAVRHPDKDEPLVPLETWRKTVGVAVDTCIQHYTQLEALQQPTDMELAALLPQVVAYVKKNEGPGSAEYWKTIDYETLLACFTTLALRPTDCPTCKSPGSPSMKKSSKKNTKPSATGRNRAKRRRRAARRR